MTFIIYLLSFKILSFSNSANNKILTCNMSVKYSNSDKNATRFTGNRWSVFTQCYRPRLRKRKVARILLADWSGHALCVCGCIDGGWTRIRIKNSALFICTLYIRNCTKNCILRDLQTVMITNAESMAKSGCCWLCLCLAVFVSSLKLWLGFAVLYHTQTCTHLYMS